MYTASQRISILKMLEMYPTHEGPHVWVTVAGTDNHEMLQALVDRGWFIPHEIKWEDVDPERFMAPKGLEALEPVMRENGVEWLRSMNLACYAMTDLGYSRLREEFRDEVAAD